MGPQVLGSILHQCSKTRSFQHGFSLHAVAIKMGFISNLIISNHVLNMYAKCGKIDFARQLFDEMSERNVVSWSAMISGYDQAGRALNAVQLFSRMKVEQANEFVFASAVSACASLLAVDVGKRIHSQSVVLGYADVSFVSNSLVSMYMKCGRCGDALSVFMSSSERNTVAYNAIITGLVENEQVQKAYEMFQFMCQQGLVPNRFSLVALLGNCSNPNDFRVGMELHCLAVKLNLDSIAFVGNVLITMYSKFNLIEDAEKIFWSIEEKDMISWNTFIAVCCHALDHAKGLSVFSEMIKTHSLTPDDFTYTSALSACSGLASSISGRQIHGNLIRTRLSYDTGVANALVNMYAKCGSIKHAVTTFNQMGFRNLVSWNTLMAGFANHGYGKHAIELFDRMKKLKTKPDSVTFIALLAALNHTGLVEEGKSYFNAMQETYGIAPNVDHVSCIVDLLGRARRVKEAEEYMERYSFEHDLVVLGCLLSACRVHGDLIVGKRTAERLLKIQKVSTSPYVLLSNLYASESMWDGVAEARKQLKDSLMKKEPGHSLIEVKGNVEKFTVGRISHPRIEEIVGVLQILSFAEDGFSWCD
ncbi:putative tetratricopeptide-like helical domain superfamily [Helianthus annuus]|uniref:Putative tetratricopeptide-like helical domain-containing protein n=1 Tax=Helianthus annuus TaxID=4232 RepID=A0A251V6P8_HELAN|nr:putative pentatricopeptide repeat-containing protein At3g47840 [Helianthus annuus]KAF5813352.1 putative tetratricopeptide-like helical domain superfamily [Helianthus annuus]KAJ0592113.1 putative tetratricopeptide-like helical domain superfamily [Helianthus annuus]KAJ0599551.1 putative tetratricopeptide-like helical domain superfamily [Helianthus annuus]KAJ0607095.1 putative tetratricopeptide-like helical domain superfamily [Helianthus annuus]KAJ0767148.1 putative tetratricopeptide-like heli